MLLLVACNSIPKYLFLIHVEDFSSLLCLVRKFHYQKLREYFIGSGIEWRQYWNTIGGLGTWRGVRQETGTEDTAVRGTAVKRT